MMARSPQVVSLRCSHDGSSSSSSSSESSEEVSQESERHKLMSQTVVALYAQRMNTQALFPQVFLRRRHQFNAPLANRGKHIFTFSFVFFFLSLKLFWMLSANKWTNNLKTFGSPSYSCTFSPAWWLPEQPVGRRPTQRRHFQQLCSVKVQLSMTFF